MQTLAILLLLLTMSASQIELDMALEPWRAINDGVMGGVSVGRMVATDRGLRFEGELSLENNGGAAAGRRRPVGEHRGAAAPAG